MTPLPHAPDAVYGLDALGRCTFANRRAAEMFGYTVSELLGADVHGLLRHSSPDGAPCSGRRCGILAVFGAGGEGHVSEELFRHRDGSPVRVRCSLTRTVGVPSGSAAVATLRPRCAGAVAPSGPESALADWELARTSLLDGLTSLPNRTLLEDALGLALREMREGHTSLGVLFIDIDRLHVVNHSMGHAAGDSLLRLVASRVRDATRPGDIVSRFGGDEFVVVCETASKADATSVARRVLEATQRPFVVDGRELGASVSIGAAVTRDPGRSPESIVRDAAAAVHRAKELGRGRFAMFDTSMRRRAVARFELEARLRRAVEREELHLAYQPIIRLPDQRLIGAEALLRWDAPGLGRVPAKDVVAIGEETGLIVPIGNWVVEHAVRQLAEWERVLAQPMTLSVNVSGHQLAQPDFVSHIASLLDETGVRPGTVDIEITESVLMEETSAISDAIDDLRQLGLGLAIDDFGTGYSSLLYLRRLPVRTLKIDRSFVAGLGRCDVDTAIVTATIELAHSLGLQALAEGVERDAQLSTLRGLGCDAAQGFLWSGPVPAGEFPSVADALSAGGRRLVPDGR